MNKILFCLVFFSLGCSVNRTITLINSEEEKILIEFKELNETNIVTIANSDENGAELSLCITYINKENKAIIKNQKVLFYHATNEGEYEQTDPNDESTARLHGYALTDNKGRIFVKTILPGDYGSSSDNRHIHTSIFGAKPEGYDIHFLQYANFGLKRFINDSDQHFLADLKYTKDSTLVAFITMEPKNLNN